MKKILKRMLGVLLILMAILGIGGLIDYVLHPDMTVLASIASTGRAMIKAFITVGVFSAFYRLIYWCFWK